MSGVVKGMDVAMKNMDVEKISKIMDDFERQFEDMDVRSGYMENAMSNSTASVSEPLSTHTASLRTCRTARGNKDDKQLHHTPTASGVRRLRVDNAYAAARNALDANSACERLRARRCGEKTMLRTSGWVIVAVSYEPLELSHNRRDFPPPFLPPLLQTPFS